MNLFVNDKNKLNFVIDKIFINFMNIRERIVSKALELFNEKGIEYVGMRELAASLNTKLGNITYYFPTKEDLILRLTADLSELNSVILQIDEKISIASYLEITRRHFECQYRYRCLFLSLVHLMKRYEKIAVRYKKIERQRKETGLINIENLVANKYLKKLSATDTEFLLLSIQLLSRFWISQAAISHSKLNPSDQIQYYLKLLANILSNYCSVKGKTQIVEFIGK